MNLFLELDRSVLHRFANSVNPLLVVLLLGAVVWRAYHDKSFRTGEFIARTLIALLLAFALGRINAALHIWPGLRGDPGSYEFPSGHTCFAASVATSLACLNRRWLWFVVPVLFLYGVLIVLPPLRFHSWLDVIGAWILTPPLAWLVHKEAKPQAAMEVVTEEASQEALPPIPEPRK